MSARSVTDLDAWQLAHHVKIGIYELLRHGPAASDVKFRDQVRNAAAAAPRNIAEGFSHDLPGEFAHFLRIASSALMETSTLLHDGLERSYFSKHDAERLTILTRRASNAVTRLLVSLQAAARPKPGTMSSLVGAGHGAVSPARTRRQARSGVARCRRRQ
jgi:four helix bundle protein